MLGCRLYGVVEFFGESGQVSSKAKTPGQVAYEAYCEKTEWKSLATGADLPRWDKLNVDIRDAWEAAAEAVMAERDRWHDPDCY